MPPPVAPEPFTGGLWTTFDTRTEATISKAFLVRSAPEWAQPLLPAAEATARIESRRGLEIRFDTGFLIGPRALLFYDSIDMPSAAVFDDNHVKIEQVIGATNDGRHGALARIEAVEHCHRR